MRSLASPIMQKNIERQEAGMSAVRAIISMLPDRETTWGAAERRQWLAALEATLVLVYGPPPEGSPAPTPPPKPPEKSER